MKRLKNRRGPAASYRIIKLEGVDTFGNRISHFVRRASTASLTNEASEDAGSKQLLN